MIAVATGIGLQQKIRQKISAFSGHIVISNFEDNQSEVSLSPISKNQTFYPRFTSVDGIAHIQAVAAKAGMIRTETSFEGIIYKGVGDDYRWQNLQEYIVEGRHPDVANGLNAEVLISKFLANRLHLKLGDKFNTFFMKDDGNGMPNLRVFEIVGVYDSGFAEFDSSYIIGDIRHLQRINKWEKDQVGAFEVFLTDFSSIEQKANEVYLETSSTLDSRSIIDKYVYIFDWLKLFDFNIVVILVIMVVVATINMVVALLVLILERTQMIGILKALGADNQSIRKIFLYNAFYLILRGLAFGNVIGIGILLIQKYFGVVKLNPENYHVNQAPVYLDFGYILLLNVGTVFVCLAVLLIPSYIITRISPVKSIRFD